MTLLTAAEALAALFVAGFAYLASCGAGGLSPQLARRSRRRQLLWTRKTTAGLADVATVGNGS
jgi:hypothetical protein